MSWRDDALCKNKNIDFWYPPLESENTEQYHAIAREVCTVCPVWQECLQDGLNENWGMWGGLTTLERSVFKDKPKKTAWKGHATSTRYRQGCRCTGCTDVHNYVSIQEKNINAVPNTGETDFDLFTILYQLLQ